MTKLWIKIIPATFICLLLGFLLIPGAGKVYAGDAYSISIDTPEDGHVVNTTEVVLVVTWFRPSTAAGVNVHVEITPLTSNFNSAGMSAAWANEKLVLDSGVSSYDWDHNWWRVYFDTAWDLNHPGLGKAPSGDYGITAILQSGSIGGAAVATAKATFFYNTGEDNQPTGGPVIDFSATPTKQKAGTPVTLTWKVTGAESVSIDPGIGSVNAEGSKPVTPTDAVRTAVQHLGGDGKTTEIVTYTATYTLKATDKDGQVTESLVNIEIQPLTMDEIFKEYQAWGTSNTSYKWLDGTSDKQPLKGPSLSGATNNLLETTASVQGDLETYKELLRWDCNAMQYRSLVCLNEMKQQGKLIGWDYMPVEGAVIARTSPYPEHQAVAIWPTGYGDSWTRTATILDPHDRQEPHMYSVTDGLDSIAPWHPDMDYSETYPNLPDSIASHSHKYQFDAFEKNTGNRWGNGQGAKTPWQNPVTIKEKQDAYWRSKIPEKYETGSDGKPTRVYESLTDFCVPVGVDCPVNLLITNSAGQRLGKLANGDMVTEFQPLDAFYWSDENGDKQWYYVLIKDTYKIEITGTGSGNFRLLTYTGGDKINDYGEQLLKTGQVATLNVQSSTVNQLTLPNGTKVTPVVKTIDSLAPPKDSSSAISDNGSLNWWVIAGTLVILVALLVLLSKARKKK